ncbi:MAG: hypothetical protein ACRC11_11410 [Xenococcaceae cyanobacterium]
MSEKISETEIVKRQESLYELERDCETSPSWTESEKMQRIQALLADDYWSKLMAKAEQRKKDLEREILNVKDSKKKERMQRDIELLSTYENLPPEFGKKQQS